MEHREFVKIRKAVAPTQDAQSILITRYVTQDDGSVKQFFCKAFEWIEYNGFDLLPTGEVSFAGNVKIDLVP